MPPIQTLRRALAATVLAACAAAPALAEPAELGVVVRLADDARLPPAAMMQVELLDVSRADAAATTLSARSYRIDSLPVEIRLPYDTDDVDARMSYAVAASVAMDGKTVLRTTTAFPALTRNAPERPEIVLEQIAPVAMEGDMPSIAGIPWQVSEIGGRLLVVEDAPTLAFDADGSFAMYGGCNRFTGSAEIGAGTISFPEAFAGTRMMCPEPRMALEQSMIDAVGAATGYVRNGSLLSLTNAAGVTVLRLNERPE
ncbi:META domain-containing protein [Salipiger bermudensis]|uniref:META domain-containing protein n=1 Tax=Salipiger bermudensis TaxID=344736 RepID=UPI001CD270DB|nr:META domain-containing protein [Salipiger bermudensis]MCA0961667.1 META domain-containing protein [Salipiger bermudensis]